MLFSSGTELECKPDSRKAAYNQMSVKLRVLVMSERRLVRTALGNGCTDVRSRVSWYSYISVLRVLCYPQVKGLNMLRLSKSIFISLSQLASGRNSRTAAASLDVIGCDLIMVEIEA